MNNLVCGKPAYTPSMRNPLLVTAYLAVFGIMVVSYDSWSDNEMVVMAVVAGFLISGLALWLFIAQDYRNRGN
jgi:protein-S-isoprenylcysteine O-methyltransferase Ste14